MRGGGERQADEIRRRDENWCERDTDMILEGERHRHDIRRGETHRWEDRMKKTDRWKYKVHKTGGTMKSKIQWNLKTTNGTKFKIS